MDMHNKLPIISTKGGDKGETSLWSGERVEKNHPAIKCVCELDLFDSYLGLSYKYLDNYSEILKTIKKVQMRLVYLKGEIATHPKSWGDYRKNNKPIKEKDVEYVDKCCDNIKSSLEESNYQITGWITYGEEGEVSAYFDYARALCRKCEIELYDFEKHLTNASVSLYIKQYINRLSDYLYWVARYLRK